MYLTVRQAERMICPYQSSEGHVMNCKADACPVWRWALAELSGEKSPSPDVRSGYCGTGGRPELAKLEEF